MKIIEINVSAKKNDVQLTRWAVIQSHPYPDINSECGRPVWRNAEGMFARHGNDGEGIGNKYLCYLVIPGTVPPADYYRKHFAGYEGNPGTITLRGKELGETSVELFGDAPGAAYPVIRVRGYESATGGERELINAQIVPHLAAFVRENAAELKAEAVEFIKKYMAAKISEARGAINKLEAQILTAVF